MGSKDAVTLLTRIRSNLSEPLSAVDMLVAGSGSQWTNTELLAALNKGKDRLWDIIRMAREDYFQVAAVTPLSLVVATKEYALAGAVRQLVGLRCTTSGYEDLRFRRVDQSAREFQDRDALPAGDNTSDSEMIYDLIGTGTIKFADFPPTALTVAYDYIGYLSDYTLSGSSTVDINDELTEYMEAYATWKVLGKMPSDTRIKFWGSEITRLEVVALKSVGKRNIRESEYVEPYDP